MITLPDPEDVQVATAWPAVDAFRRAQIRALDLRRPARTLLRYAKDAAARWPQPEHEDIREGAYKRYREAVDEAAAAEEEALTLEEVGNRVSVEATVRAKLSVVAYSTRLAAERAYERARP